MKFDFVVGNPPYNEDVSIKETENGQKRSKSIFQYFQIEADKLASKGTVLIYPGVRWLHRSGRGMEQFGLEQINDKRLANIEFYPNASEVFPSVDIADGITIVTKKMDKDSGGFEYFYVKGGAITRLYRNNPGKELLVLNPEEAIIMDKVESVVILNSLCYLHDSVLSQKLFRIESDFVSKNPDKVRPYTEGCSFNPDIEIKLFTNDKAGKAGRATWFIANKSVIMANADKINEWQVVVSSANAGGQKRDNQLEIIDNHSAFGRARVALKSFKTSEEAKNFYNYCKTYLVRFTFLMTDEALTSLGKKVPDLMDYSFKNTLVDFNSDLDEQLFSLCNFTVEERQYIINRVDSIRNKS